MTSLWTINIKYFLLLTVADLKTYMNSSLGVKNKRSFTPLDRNKGMD